MAERTAVRVPHENVNDETALLSQWLVADGSTVAAGQPLAVMESSKTTFEITAPVAGIVRYSIAVGTEVAIGGVLCTIGDSSEPAPPVPTPTVTAPAAAARPLSPSARALAAQNGIDPTAVIGTGRGGRIVKQDLIATAFAEPRFSQAARALLEENGLDASQFAGRGLVQVRDVQTLVNPQLPKSKPPAQQKGSPSTIPFRTEPLSRAKRTEIKYLQRGQSGVLASSVSALVPTSGLRSAATHLPGGLTTLIVFETARLLRKYPILNAGFADGSALIYEPVNIGVAMDAGRGLKVPIIHAADTLTAPEVGRRLEELLIAYADDKLPAAALSGGTFTVSDLSGEGAFGLAPLINDGQSAILGVGGEIALAGGRVFQLILAFDHRLAEGRPAAQFLNDLQIRLLAHEAALKPPPPADAEPTCARCRRTHADLESLGAFMLHASGPDRKPALLCSICLAGW